MKQKISEIINETERIAFEEAQLNEMEKKLFPLVVKVKMQDLNMAAFLNKKFSATFNC